ncbi:MAG TPA: ABC transporter permease [Acidimicrobiales bacterium]|nr:ABC transporter permease [Acidimicrobiales bacterium]
MSLLTAFVKRDFRLERSYRLAFVTQIAGAFTTLLQAGFLSHLVPSQQHALRPYGGDYFTFALVGTAALSYFSVALGSFSGSLGQEQQQGTLEALLVTPNEPRRLLLYGAAWPFLFATIELILYTTVGALLFHAHIAYDNLALATGMLFLTLAAFSAVGLLVSSVIVLTKRAGLLTGMIGSAFALFGGVLYPISVLPRPLQWLANALPMSHGLDGVRRALTATPDMGAIGQDALVLAVFAVLLTPLALQVFEWAVARARRQGSLSHY